MRASTIGDDRKNTCSPKRWSKHRHNNCRRVWIFKEMMLQSITSKSKYSQNFILFQTQMFFLIHANENFRQNVTLTVYELMLERHEEITQCLFLDKQTLPTSVY